MKWTIGRRLGVGFGGMILLIAGMGAFTWDRVHTTGQSTALMSRVANQANETGDAIAGIHRTRALLNRYLLKPSDEREAAFKSQMARVRESLNSSVSSLETEEQQTALQDIAKHFEDWSTAAIRAAEYRKTKDKVFYEQCGPTGSKLELDARALASSVSSDPKLQAVLSLLVADINDARLGVARYLVTTDDAEFERATKAAARVKSSLDRLINAQEAGPVKTQLSSISAQFDSYLAIGSEVRTLMAKSQQVVDEDLFKAGDEIGASAASMLANMDKFIDAERKITEEQVGTAKLFSIVGGVIASFIGVVFAFFIARSIIRPLNAVIDRLKDIAQGEGDLTQRVDEKRGDELGVLGKWFNVFVVRIQDLMKDVSAASRQVAAASTQIAASSEQMASGLDKQKQQTQQVSAAVEEMSSSVIEVSKKSADAARSAEDAGKQAAGGGEVVQQTLLEMKSISEQVTESAKSVNNLGTKSEQIGQIISVINDIADQTNLLALNAAIEAARAGEHGRGFAVVADEVRKLAERTQKATEEVAGSIREIQSDTTSAVACIETGTKKVDSGVRLANEAGGALQQIVGNSEKLRQMVQSIAAAAEEQSAASEQIARSVEQINAVARESAEGAQQSSKAAADLSTQAETLQKLVGRFKIG